MIKPKYIAFFLVTILVAASALAQSFPTTPILTTFDGTESPLSEGGNWVGGITGTGDCDKTAGVATKGTGTTDCYWDANTFGANQEIYVTLPNASSQTDVTNLSVYACLQDFGSTTVDGYRLDYRPDSGGTNTVRVYLLTDGNPSASLLDSTAQTLADNNKMGMRIQSNGGITVYVNTGSGWGAISTFNDTTLNCAGTKFGMDIPNSSHQLEDLGGGNTSRPFFMILEAR